MNVFKTVTCEANCSLVFQKRNYCIISILMRCREPVCVGSATTDSGVNCNDINFHTEPMLQDRRHHTVLIKIK